MDVRIHHLSADGKLIEEIKKYPVIILRAGHMGNVVLKLLVGAEIKVQF